MSSAITIAAVGTGLSAYNASNANKNAGKALSAQQKSQQDALDFKEKQYDRYLGLMGPIEEQQSRDAQSEQPLDYDKNAAAIKSNYGQAQRNITSAMGMRGMAGSGTDVGATRGAAFTQAGALSDANATGLQNRRNLGLTLTGKGQIQSAANGVGQGMQGMANLYGQQAGMYGNAAQQGWNNAAGGLGGIAGIMARMNANKPEPGEDQTSTIADANMPSDTMNSIDTTPRDDSFDYTQAPGF